MKGRISLTSLTLGILLASTGCVFTQNQKSSEISVPVGLRPEEMPIITRKPDGPKRAPKASTEIAFGEMREAEADSEAYKNNAEAQGRFRDEARKAYQGAIKTEPDNLKAHRCLGGLHLKCNEFDRAIDTYKKAMAKHPKESILWYDMSTVYARKKDFPECARCLGKALEMDPENRDYMKKLGFTLAWMGQMEQGLAYLTRAQGPAMAHYNIARVFLQREQHQLARHHLNASLQANNQLPEARELLAALDSPSARN